MPQTWMVDIDETPDPPGAAFNPQELAVAAGDLVFWRNNTSKAHQPTPAGQPPDTWMDEIPGKFPREPAPTSRVLTFSGAMTVDYVCALHPDMTGKITVT